MSVIQACFDVKDTLDLFRPQGLYLKPISRLNVSVQLPQLKKSGAKISNWEVMERVKDMAKPFTFPVFKVRCKSEGRGVGGKEIESLVRTTYNVGTIFRWPSLPWSSSASRPR